MKILSKIVASVALASSLFASDVVVYKSKDHKAINFQSVSAIYKSKGFSVEAVSKLDGKFKKKFKDNTFDKFKIMAVYNKDIAKKLLIKYPDAGAFLPYSVVLQSFSNSDDVTFTTLSVDTMKKVLNIKEEFFFDKLEKKNNKIASMLGFDTKSAVKFDYEVAAAKGDLLFKKEIEGDAVTLAKKLTDTMKSHKFSIVNELDFAKRYKVIGAKYDFYKTFSICKVKVLYLASKTRPEAAAFAPCSLAIYKEKGSNKVTVAFPSTYNWLSSLNMQDKKAVDILNKEQKEIEGFINSL
jgi:uncharacterized protein (DUF302 family)